ncbi:hypothetical protein F511_31052 [Dorcoceras hygrometricum]|uniref:Uncharacterized protein n=1 Tax=Dorcoceras hygrometricum TaxID=472368 RepID=A0A2Z7BHD5_9LAMI|nr:hypothetical protein F511_31052 [Dorcoceras hygrometricum]
MSSKEKRKTPKCSCAFPAKSLNLFSRVPRPSTVESPANPFLISCISHQSLVHRASISSLPQNPSAVLPSCVASSNLRPSIVAFQGVSLSFASYSSTSNHFGVPRLSAMSNSEQCVDLPAADNRSGAVTSVPMEVIGPLSHPSYFNNPLPLAVRPES